MPRPPRSGVFVCVAVVALAALLPGMAAVDWAVLQPEWVLLPELVVVAPVCANAASDEQPCSLLSLLRSRAPPALVS